MKIVSRLLILIAMMLIFGFDSGLNKPISLVCISSFAPYAWEEDGELKGIDVDIVNELFDRAGLKKTVTSVPAQRAIAYLMSGNVDGGFSGIKTARRQKIAIYADVPVHRSVYKLFVKKGREFEFNSIEDLYGKRIGKNKSFVISYEFIRAEKEGKIVTDSGAVTVEQNLSKLRRDRFDALVGNVNEIRYAIKAQKLEGAFTELPNPIIDPIDAYLVFSKASKLENKEQILKKLSSILKEMEQDGTIAAIHSKYLD